MRLIGVACEFEEAVSAKRDRLANNTGARVQAI
jgi:hypothetical protein